jgi:hypothetical protein
VLTRRKTTQFLILILVAKSALGQITPPSITGPLHDGDSTIPVIVGANALVELWINSVKSIGLGPVSGPVTFRLPRGLAVGDVLQIKEVINGTTLESARVTVGEIPKPTLSLDSIKEGSPVEVTGKLTGRSPTGLGPVSITVNGVPGGSATVKPDGTFSVTVGRELKAGDSVVATQSVDGNTLTSPPGEVQAVQPRKDPLEGLRYYLPNGAEESEIRQFQAKMEQYRRAAGSPAPDKRAQVKPGCVDDDFESTRMELQMKLHTRLERLTAALNQATQNSEVGKYQKAGGGDNANYERVVRNMRAAIEQTQKEIARIPDGICPLRATPFNLVTIYEETEKERIQQYNPVMPDQRLTTFSIDKGSKLRIEVNPEVLTPDALVGQLKIAGTLTGADGKTAKVEVANYSQVNMDPKSQKSQQAVNIQAASDIKGAFSDLYSVVLQLVTSVYGGKAPTDWVNGDFDKTWWGLTPNVSKMTSTETQPIDAVYKQYKNEIESIDEVLTSNPTLLNMVATSIFGMPQSTLEAFLKDFKTNLETMLNAEYLQTARDRARAAVVQTTLDIWSALSQTQDYIDARNLIAPNLPNSEPEDEVFEEMYRQVIDTLKRQIQPGEIDLPSYQVQDGATLLLQVEVAGSKANADPSSGGSSSVALFTVRIKDYRARPGLVDATFYLRRMKDVRAQNGTLARVNFAPAPGATLDVTFHSRGPSGLLSRCMDHTGVLTLASGKHCPANGQTVVLVAHQTAGNRFFSALAPGLGVNVSLLNFTNPAFLTPSGTGYTTPDAAPVVQIGTGVVLSLFGGALQATYGWDLNIEAPRSYWGVGFSFVKIGQAAVQKLSPGSSAGN